MKKNIFLTILIIIFTFILVTLLSFTFTTVEAYRNSEKFTKNIMEFVEKNQDTIFSISKITYFSSCSADVSTNSNFSFTISDLYQYTDIAIFITPNSTDLTAKNTLKTVALDNIKYTLLPSIGTPYLYYKNINEFATPKYEESNIIYDSIEFEATSESTIDYSKPILYNNCANPITISYANKNIIDNYTLSNKILNILHNGALLKNCGITLNSIACKMSFDIIITNNLDETYLCPLSINIPLSTESSTIYDGSLTLKELSDYNFIRE